MRGEDHRASLSDDAQDAVPQEAAGFRVHPRGGLVLQHTQTCELWHHLVVNTPTALFPIALKLSGSTKIRPSQS